MELTEGKYLIKIARKAIEYYLEKKKILEIPKNIPKKLMERRGVFVTVKKGKGLRGCIGFPLPIKPLILATIEAAIESAFFDSRFFPLQKNELNEVTVEISVLTDPKILVVDNPKKYLRKIKIGRDGLIIQRNFNSGLLLPQVPVEFNWKVKEFLEQTCLKAGLNRDAWLDKETKIYTFQAEIFKEVKPNGKVVKVKL
jgi:hypothetical protein